ncbi:MAG: hypothetical protein WD046_07795 [Paracoccaceae bacterium]
MSVWQTTLIGAAAKGAQKNLRPALPDQAVYLDSPILTALRQIEPFYRDGMFDAKLTPLLLRQRALVRLQSLGQPMPHGIRVERITSSHPELAPGAVVFYPFNSQSNMNAVTNRSAKHVLTLHGESHKHASMRPAARLYDYVCIAGPLARDRYLRAGIFSHDDVDGGRLVMMGDSFVQSLPWAKASVEGALLYCPTWEGYGQKQNNYSSLADMRGFETSAKVARAAKIAKILIKPHPYLGLLKPGLLRNFIKGAKWLRREGFEIHLVIHDSSPVLRQLCHVALAGMVRHLPDADNPVAVKLGLCDVSGMEAVFLKEGIAHMVMGNKHEMPAQLDDIYRVKALHPGDDVARKLQNYIEHAPAIDQAHRNHAFGWHDENLSRMKGSARRDWLLEYVRKDPHWKGGSPAPGL